MNTTRTSKGHTAGPWVFGQDDAKRYPDNWGVGLSRQSGYISGCSPRRGSDDYMLVSGCCREADARLIAAAPDLLSALEYARNLIGPDEILDAALRKASEGTQP
jgi:hypothetical protein